MAQKVIEVVKIKRHNHVTTLFVQTSVRNSEQHIEDNELILGN